MAASPELHPRADRRSPIAGVILTDTELDHTLGLLLLREADQLHLHATQGIRQALTDGRTVLSTLPMRCCVIHHEVNPGTDIALTDRLSYRAFDAPSTKPSRTDTQNSGTGRVVGYRFTDRQTGQSLVYLPGMQQLTPAVRDELDQCTCLLVDGTFWSDDELFRLGLSSKTALQMGHLPIAGAGGSMEELSRLQIGRTIYAHINNTNPILLEDSPEHQVLNQHGMEAATDGLEMEI